MDHSPITPDQSYYPTPQDWAAFNFSATSTPTKRTPTRITKPGYSYNSPQGVHRRRTTASHTSRGSTSSYNEARNGYQYQKDGSVRYRWPVDSHRPLSWHPGARLSQGFSNALRPGEQTLGQTINGIEHLQVSSQESLILDTNVGASYAASGSSSIYHVPTPYSTQSMYEPVDLTAQNYNHQPALAYSNNTLCDPGNPSGFEDLQLYLPQGYMPATTMPYSDGNHHPTNINPIHESQQLSQMQLMQLQAQQTQQAQQAPVRPRNKDSKELVSLGLYDDAAQVQRESIGKTLKLEDAWQPIDKKGQGEKNDLVIACQEDDSSTDEDEEEVPAVHMTSEIHGHVPVYQDLSNQSFFFEEEDPYSGLVAVGQEASFYQPKMPENVQASFSWI